MAEENKSEQRKKGRFSNRRRALTEWGIIVAVFVILYATGLHAPVLGTLQQGLLTTGLIKPSIPEGGEVFPEASPAFYFADENGQVMSLDDYRGQVILMNVWATWCPPCIAEMPSLHRLYQGFKGDPEIAFLFVSMDEDIEKAHRFMESRGFDLPVVHFRSKARGSYESTVIPTTYVITKDFRLALEKRGLAKYDTDEMREFLRGLMERDLAAAGLEGGSRP